MEPKKIVIIGAGTVGRATGETLQHVGHEVIFLDINDTVIESLKNNGYQAFNSNDSLDGITGEIIILTVNTPLGADRRVDLSYLINVTKNVGMTVLKNSIQEFDYPVYVNRCTNPPFTTKNILQPLLELDGHKMGVDFGIAYYPEYLRAKTNVEDRFNPWFTLIADNDDKSAQIIIGALEPLLKNSPVYKSEIETAEYQKYLNNLFNAAKISFFNESYTTGLKLGLKPEQLEQAISLTAESAEGSWNPRYGTRMPGHPYGGACLPKDTIGLFSHIKDTLEFDAPLLKAIIDVNDELCKTEEEADVEPMLKG